MGNPSVVEIENVSKRFVIRKEKSLKERVVNFGRSNLHKEDFWALRDVSLTIESGTTVGLIGPNGSGKSTLLKTIGGILQPTTGTVQVRGRMAALLELGAGFHPDLTGRENVYLNASILGLSTAQTDQFFDAIVDFSGIAAFIDTQVKFYSSGMYVRLAFAVAVHVDPDVLLVDEVLAVGDEPFQRKCMDRIRQFQQEGRTIILVTHGLDQVADLCDRAIVLERGVVKADGHPLDALRVLRSEFDQIREDELTRERAAVGAAVGAPRAQVTKVETIVDGTPAETVGLGSPMTVRLTVEAEQELRDWTLGFGFDSSHGQAIYSTSSRLLGVPMPPLRGTASFDFTIPATWLGEGAYTAHGSVGDASDSEIHILREAARLHVTTPGQEIGLVSLGATLDPRPV